MIELMFFLAGVASTVVVLGLLIYILIGGWGEVMIDKRTIGIIRKPHISYLTSSESWVCISEDGPWDICMGAGESVLEAYKSWESKVPRAVVETSKHWSGPCQDGGKWRLT